MRELLDKRPIFPQGLLQLLKVGFGNEQQGLGPQHFQVAFVKDIIKEVGFALQLRSQALDELSVFGRVFAFHHYDEIVLGWELLFEFQRVLVVFFVCPDQVVTPSVEFQMFDRIDGAHDEQHQLRVNKKAAVTEHGPGQPGQGTRHEGVFGKPFNLHGSIGRLPWARCGSVARQV